MGSRLRCCRVKNDYIDVWRDTTGEVMLSVTQCDVEQTTTLSPNVARTVARQLEACGDLMINLEAEGAKFHPGSMGINLWVASR